VNFPGGKFTPGNACFESGNEIHFFEMTVKNQSTLKQTINFCGKTLFTGVDVVVKLIPAPPQTGIVFRRTDLPGSPEISASTESVIEAAFTTRIGTSDVYVQLIEHLMAALFACNVNNLIVEISGPEVPILDGSALPWIELIEKAGIVPQEAIQPIYSLDTPCCFTAGETHIIAIPADEFRVSYTLHYPHSPYLKSQYFSSTITPSLFKKEIAPSRTFTLYQDVMQLIQKGILKNGALEHGVVIDGEKVLNPDGVRFSDEMVRHKVLDLVGDIALLGWQLRVHLIGIKTGHAANHAIAKELRKSLRKQ
jgi:UDP-3-O-[3-hydroxymyristoyl] N-acetylglucosamine deacetylase